MCPVVDARFSALVTSLPPERVARAEFSTSFRGFDPTEVRAFLARVAGEIRALSAREGDLLERLAEVERQRSAPAVAEKLDEHRMTELLGIEAARILEAARDSAGRIRAAAREEADQQLGQARLEADALASSAETVVAERAALAVVEGERIRAEAEADAVRIRAAADAQLANAQVESAALVDQARAEGRRMVAEARQVRERVLTDMARRRNAARQQLERLKAGRDRLAEAIEHVRRTVEESATELSGSVSDAKLAGDRAARTVDLDLIPSAGELETEVVVARDAGLIDQDAIDLAAFREEDPNTGEVAVVEMVLAPLSDEPPADVAWAPAPTSEHGEVPATPARRPVIIEDTVETEPAPPASEEETQSVEETLPDTIVDLRVPVAQADEVASDIDLDAEPDVDADGEIEPAARRGFSTRVDAVFTRLREPAGAPPSDAGRAATTKAKTTKATKAAALASVSELTEPGAPAEPADSASDNDIDPVALADRIAVHTRDAQVAGPGRDLTRQLKLALSDEQNVLLETVRERSADKLSMTDLGSELDAAATYATVARRELHNAARAGWQSLTGDQPAPEEIDLGPVAERLGAELAAALRAQLAEAFDGDRSRFADLLRAAYRQARNRRANEIAEHGVLAAFTQGQLAAVGSGAVAGGVALVRWVFEACGPDCLDNSLAGPLALGDPFPTGHLHPPAWPGCRCLLVMVDQPA